MNAQDVLKYGHLWVLKHLDGLTPDEMETPGVCGFWSVKEIVAHLASYETVLYEIGCELTAAGPTPNLDQFRTLPGDEFNALQVGQLRSLSPAEIQAEYTRRQAQAAEMFGRIPPGLVRQNGVLPWYGAGYDLEDFITYTFYGHKREHCAQIAVHRERLGK